MKPDIVPDRTAYATQVLCIDRKLDCHPTDRRQNIFAKSFSKGCDGIVMSSQEAWHLPSSHPWYIRGMKLTKSVKYCRDTGRTFYYTDNGYIGNVSKKTHFRIIKNNVHDCRPIQNRDDRRLRGLIFKLKAFSTGRKILLAPPSPKSFSMWDMDQNRWIEQTVAQLEKYTDRPIEIRMKRNRADRNKIDTMEQTLANDVHCVVTYSSVAAVEAVMLGKPAIVLGPNAAQEVCSRSLSEIEKPYFPDNDHRHAWLRHLSYSQFTFAEMSDGTAWRILNEG